MIEVRPVTNKKELRSFIMLPFELYKDDPNWVAPLIGEQMKFFDPQHNPFYLHSEVQLFLAYKDGKVVGRITAHTNTEHNKEHKDNTGFFGFFESIDDQQVANSLFAKAVEWNKAHGKDIVRGPMNLSVNDECGQLVKGFDTPPFVMMTHHLPYMQHLIEKAGFAKVMDLYAYKKYSETVPSQLEKAALYTMKRNSFSVRTLSKNKKDMQRDIEQIFDIYTRAWEYNWGYVPMTRAEMQAMCKTLLPIVDTDVVLIAESNGEPIGFSLALPNYNQVLKVMNGRVNPITMVKAYLASRKINSARVITMGVVKEFQNRGVNIVFHYMSYKNGIPKGYLTGEFSWVLETNQMMIREAEMLGAEIHKVYRLYDKAVV